LTIKKFMTFDLIVLSVVAVLVDVVGYIATRTDLVFFYMMLSLPVMLIAYMRWGYKALWINLVVMGLHILLYGTSEILGMMIYLLSILSVSSALIWFKFVDKKLIKNELLLLTLYYVSTYLILFFIQVLAQWSIDSSIQWVTLIIRHGVNFFLGWVILVIASRQEDLLVDMKSYLLKQIEERKDEGLQR